LELTPFGIAWSDEMPLEARSRTGFETNASSTQRFARKNPQMYPQQYQAKIQSSNFEFSINSISK
jgi:hypothetical protein